jgi:hypothetical protein
MKRARGTSDNGAEESLFETPKKSSNKCIDKNNLSAGGLLHPFKAAHSFASSRPSPNLRRFSSTWKSRRVSEVGRRPLDWASRFLQREFEVVIMVEVLIGEMFGSD